MNEARLDVPQRTPATVSPKVAGVRNAREAGHLAQAFANMRRRVKSRMKARMDRSNPAKIDGPEPATATDVDGQVALGGKAIDPNAPLAVRRETEPDAKDANLFRVASFGMPKEIGDANFPAVPTTDEPTIDNLEIIKPSHSVIDSILTELERAFPALDTAAEDSWRNREREQSPPFLLDLLFPGSKLLYYAVIGIIICITAHCKISITWALLMWVLLEGFALGRLLKRMVTKATGFPYNQEVDRAFVLDPECETVAWMNDVTKCLWDKCLRGFFRTSLKACLNELLKRKFSTWSRHALWRSFVPQVTYLELGEKPPWVTAMKAYVSESNLFSYCLESATLDFGIVCAIQCNLQASIAYIFRIGIRELMVNAPFRLRMIPLLRCVSWPFHSRSEHDLLYNCGSLPPRDEALFGQIQLSFLSMPNIFYHTYGLAGVMAFPFIRPLCLGSLKQVASFLIYPLKLVLPNPLVEAFKDHTIFPVSPWGILRVRVVEALDLPDVGNLGKCPFKVDPYVILKLGPQAEKSSVMHKDSRPQWNEIFEFTVTEQDYRHRELKVYVLDFEWGFWTDDHAIGFTSVSVKNAVKTKKSDQWYVLGQGIQGRIRLQISYVPIMLNTPPVIPLTVPRNPRESQAILEVLAFEVRTSHLCKPMLVFQASGRKAVTTSHGQLSNNWEFAEEFYIPIHDVDKDTLTISLVDYEAKRSVKAVTQKVCKTMKNFIAESDDPQVVKPYSRGSNYLLGEIILDLQDFTGQRQQIELHSDVGGIYKIIVIGRLYFLTSNIHEELTKMR
jgi:hypothetical protein